MLVSVGAIGAQCGRDRATADAVAEAGRRRRAADAAYRMSKGEKDEVPDDRPQARCRPAGPALRPCCGDQKNPSASAW
ncbi:hypothetical protein WS66_12705 [Burkholderia sp. LA-2-3-30-S1-D2]|nr:hypothetical protein WS66_12705 [Burkholderia sp. LA-2-3-30-S1-D2]KVE15835.1 hypothetical protein WS66_08745 [Burkholderia sp. LA-2-3-30-S1-D2]